MVDPAQGTDGVLDVHCRAGRVFRVGKNLAPGRARVIDARGYLVLPGLIDAHCHLREPGREDEETIESGAAAAAAGGFTTLLAMPNTDPCVDNGPLAAFVRERGDHVAVTVLPIGAITRNREGQELTEMVDLAEHGAVAFSDDGNYLADSRLMRKALAYARITGLPLIDHAEEPCLARGGVMNEGALSAVLGLPGIPSAAEEIAVFRDITLAALTGGKMHLAHLTCAGSVDLLRRAKKKRVPVTDEVTVHHLLLTEEAVRDYDTNAKVSPPLRTSADRNALRRGVRDGTIELIVTDHAPHGREEKETDFQAAAFGMIGLETALPLLLSLVPDIPLARLVAGLTCGPARTFNLAGRGTLESGCRADITVIDPTARWVLTPDRVVSRSRNTPFLGRTLRGRVLYTVCGGRVVFGPGR